MNEEYVRLWVDALRSGKYNKHRASFRENDHTFCALGVAVEVYRTTTGRGEWQGEDFILPGKTESDSFEEVKDWLDISTHLIDDIVYKNDEEDETLSEIADFIERQSVLETS